MINHAGLDAKALEAARKVFLSIFGDPSAVPADYGLEVAATIRAYISALPSPSVIGSDTAGLPSGYAGLVDQTLRDAKHVIQKTESLNDPRYHRATSILGRIDEAIAALSRAPEAVAEWQVWAEDDFGLGGWVNEDANMIEYWRSRGRKVRVLCATRPAPQPIGCDTCLLDGRENADAK